MTILSFSTMLTNANKYFLDFIEIVLSIKVNSLTILLKS